LDIFVVRTDLLKALFYSFETWFIWVNLIGIYVYSMYGVYSKPLDAPFRTAVFNSVDHERNSVTISYLMITLTGFVSSIMDAFQKSAVGNRIRVLIILMFLIVIVRVMSIDRLEGNVFYAQPVWFLYESDTRSLVLQCMQNVVVFFGYVTICCLKFYFLFLLFDSSINVAS
jgi:hypothetical protein